jgi:hypothetical protein
MYLGQCPSPLSIRDRRLRFLSPGPTFETMPMAAATCDFWRSGKRTRNKSGSALDYDPVFAFSEFAGRCE